MTGRNDGVAGNRNLNRHLGGPGQIVVVLEIEPEKGRRAEGRAKAQGGLGGNDALAANDLTDSKRANIHAPRQLPHGQSHRLHEFHFQNFVRSDQSRPQRDAPFFQGLFRQGRFRGVSLMVVGRNNGFVDHVWGLEEVIGLWAD